MSSGSEDVQSNDSDDKSEEGEASINPSAEAPSEDQQKKPEEVEQDPEASKDGFVQRLKEYKEFVAVLVFFLGGVTWAYGVFATQQQINQLKCLLNTNISLIHNQTQSRFLLQELTSKQMHLAEILERQANGKPGRGDPRRGLELEASIDLLKTTSM